MLIVCCHSTMKNRKKLLAIAASIIAIATATVSMRVMKKQIPVLQYSPAPQHADTTRFIQVEWLNLWDLVDDPYGEGELKWRADFDEQIKNLANRLNKHKKGERALFEWHIVSSSWVNPSASLLWHRENGCRNKDGTLTEYTDFNNRKRPYACPWLEVGVKASAEKWTKIMKALKKAGAKIDYFTTENEASFTPWGFVPGQAQAIQDDPRFPKLAEELGYKNLVEATNFFNEREKYITMLKLFNDKTLNAFLEGVYEPIWAVYPNLRTASSDYAKYSVGNHLVFDINGWELNRVLGPNPLPMSGTDLNYLSCAGLCARNGNEVTGPFPPTDWNQFILAMNQARAIVLANPESGFWPYIGPESFNQNVYYKELVIHSALLMNKNSGFVYWNPQEATTLEDFMSLKSIVDELDPYLSYTDRKSLVSELIPWQAEKIETCAVAKRKKVCRVVTKGQPGVWTVQ